MPENRNPSFSEDETINTETTLPNIAKDHTETTLPNIAKDHTETTLPNIAKDHTPITKPVTVTIPKSKPAWPPPPRSYRRRTGLSTALKVLVAILALLLMIGGISFITYSTTIQYGTSIRHTATVAVQSTHKVVTTAQAHEQGTADALSTAQANIEATATSQANGDIQATTTIDNATATATALGDLYTNSTNGTPILDDPLSDNTGSGKWDEGSPSTNTGCTFSTTDTNYHVSEAQQSYFQPCVAQETRFSSFAYQVHLTFNKGNQGQAGLLFRIDSSNKNYYFFHIGIDGSYTLEIYQNNTPKTLSKGLNPAITIGQGKSNQIAVVANSNKIYLFANGQYLDSAADSTFSVGKIGLGVVNHNTPVDVSFSDAQVWQLQTTNQPTGPGLSPSPSADPVPGLHPSPSAKSNAGA